MEGPRRICVEARLICSLAGETTLYRPAS